MMLEKKGAIHYIEPCLVMLSCWGAVAREVVAGKTVAGQAVTCKVLLVFACHVIKPEEEVTDGIQGEWQTSSLPVHSSTSQTFPYIFSFSIFPFQSLQVRRPPFKPYAPTHVENMSYFIHIICSSFYIPSVTSTICLSPIL